MPHLETPLPTWVGVGGSPESVIRAAHYGFSLMLAVIGGPTARFAPYSNLFLQALEQFGHAPKPVGLHSPGHVAATDEQAYDEFWPRYLEVITRASRTRGFAIPTEASFRREIGPGRLAVRRIPRDRRPEDREEHDGRRCESVRPEVRDGRPRATRRC